MGVTVIDPSGEVLFEVQHSGEEMNDGIAVALGGPATWQFSLIDDVAGCRREFTVEPQLP